MPFKRLAEEGNDQLSIVYESVEVNNMSVNQEMILLFFSRVNKPIKIIKRIPTLRIISGIANPKLFVIDSSLMLIPVSNGYGF
jgi:hypothetical protein